MADERIHPVVPPNPPTQRDPMATASAIEEAHETAAVMGHGNSVEERIAEEREHPGNAGAAMMDDSGNIRG